MLLTFLLGLVAPFSSAATVASFGFQPLAHPIRINGSIAHIARSSSTSAAPATPTQAPTDAYCRATYGVPCFSPQEMQTAYNLTPLLGQGYNGAGQTIVIIDSFGSPTIRRDLATFDSDYGLPAPPSFQIAAPLGTVPFDPNNSDMVNWAFETSLDVEWAHAMAPGANIVLLTSPVDETEGTQGMPDFLLLEQFALKNHLGSIISQSWGATEQTLLSPSGQKVVADFEAFYQSAAQQHVTVLASAGDDGVANFKQDLTTFYPFPTVIYPASSSWVTAVGGTSLATDTSGNYQSEIVWNDNSIGVPIATGGGVSTLFSEPSYQLGLNAHDQQILNGHRAIPDIAYNADPYTSILVYTSFLGSSAAGYYFIGGTSEGAPQWAGLVAVGNQLGGHSLGFLNPGLYHLANGVGYASSFHDVTVGDNGNEGIPGYVASAGWDPTTGLGSPNAANLLPALAGLN